MTSLWIVVGLLCACVIVTAFAVIALAREVGLLSLRLPPAPALAVDQGPDLGEMLPSMSVLTVDGATRHSIDFDNQEKARILLFLSPNCSTCRDLLRELDGIQSDWPEYEVVPVVNGQRAAVTDMTHRNPSRMPVYRDGGEAMRSAGVAVTPTAIIVDNAGIVLAHGVVNTREMVGSLITGHIRAGSGLLPADILSIDVKP